MDSDGRIDEDQEEFCQTLQAHAKLLEQRELSQMRQAAILRKKIEDAEQQLREMQRSQEVKQEGVARCANEKKQAAIKEAARSLETEWRERQATVDRKRQELETKVRDARSRRQQLQADLDHWRRRGQELLRDDTVTARRAKADELDNRAGQVQAEIEKLQASCRLLEARLPEVSRLADAARNDEVQLRLRNERTESAIVSFGASTARSRSAALADAQQEGLLLEAMKELSEQAEQERKAASAAHQDGVPTGSTEELAHMERRVQDRQREVLAFERERDRLRGLLQRHTGEDVHARDPGATGTLNSSEGGGGSGFVDEVAGWLSMMLFKSVFARRAFCVHLAVLYSWLLFLLWYMSLRAGSH
eukprot:CAMPEP_0172802672 /NCGR_PEP_ID=MMETSP1075-20121228/4031_1 /TAXON_ID=2916 /ORGANISM="Ceratium fusus, Strain PA161109" /LENGTH=361 /DNA_ID=CAMNT_0013640983 /DNA_START=52 /DNA_END=1137 /DNA_ORIENTATION=-